MAPRFLLILFTILCISAALEAEVLLQESKPIVKIPLAKAIDFGFPVENAAGEIAYLPCEASGTVLTVQEKTSRCLDGERAQEVRKAWAGLGRRLRRAPVAQPCVADSFGNWWALRAVKEGRREVVVLPAQKPEAWRTLEGEAELGAGPWQDIETDLLGYVWVLGAGALLRFDPRNPDAGWLSNAAFLKKKVCAIGRAPSGNLLVALEDASFYELDIDAQGNWRSRELEISLPEATPILALYSDRYNRLWIFSPNRLYRIDGDAAWIKGPSLPMGNHAFGLATTAKEAVMVGGIGCYGYPAELQMHTTCYRYTAHADAWESLSPLPAPRAFPGAAFLEGALWVCGGYAQKEEEKKQAQASVYMLDSEGAAWRDGPRLDKARAEAILLSARGRLYCIGGVGDTEEYASMVSIASDESQWREEATAPMTIRQAAGCVFQDALYICRGPKTPAEKASGFYIYDLVKQEWRIGRALAHQATHAPQLCAWKGRIYRMGGWGIKPEFSMKFF